MPPWIRRLTLRRIHRVHHVNSSIIFQPHSMRSRDASFFLFLAMARTGLADFFCTLPCSCRSKPVHRALHGAHGSLLLLCSENTTQFLRMIWVILSPSPSTSVLGCIPGTIGRFQLHNKHYGVLATRGKARAFLRHHKVARIPRHLRLYYKSLVSATRAVA